MNTPSPLIPQGMLPENRGKSQLRIAVITIVAVHVVLLGALLLQGCKKSADPNPQDQAAIPDTYAPPPINTNELPPPPPPLPPPSDPQVGTQPPQDPMVTTQLPPQAPVVDPQPPIDPPQPPPPQPPQPAQGLSEHVIVKGDSFALLSKKYNVPVKAIVSANPNVNPTRLKIGQKVNIPAPTSNAPAAGDNSSAARTGGNGGEGGKTYTVKSGDTLTKIARQNGVTVKELRAANKLRVDRITVGQKLRIPTKANSGTTGAPATQ